MKTNHIILVADESTTFSFVKDRPDTNRQKYADDRPDSVSTVCITDCKTFASEYIVSHDLDKAKANLLVEEFIKLRPITDPVELAASIKLAVTTIFGEVKLDNQNHQQDSELAWVYDFAVDFFNSLSTMSCLKLISELGIVGHPLAEEYESFQF